MLPDIAVAPMIDVTHRHCRYFLRLLCPKIRLYTEMLTTGALLHGDVKRLLTFDPSEHPLALQLGGSDPKALAACAKLAEDFGFDEVNLNIGCPSDRVQAGRFGACLMKEPERVAQAVSSIKANTHLPVTIKTRLGVDHEDSYEFLTHFIDLTNAAGCDYFIIHARNAWLQGLSPKENRNIPPLNYERVYQLKQDYPKIKFMLNGGVKSVGEIQHHLSYVDGVMLGREIITNSNLLVQISGIIYEHEQSFLRKEIMTQYLTYIERMLKQNEALSRLIHPLMGLFHGQAYARRWRRLLTEATHDSLTTFKHKVTNFFNQVGEI